MPQSSATWCDARAVCQAPRAGKSCQPPRRPIPPTATSCRAAKSHAGPAGAPGGHRQRILYDPVAQFWLCGQSEVEADEVGRAGSLQWGAVPPGVHTGEVDGDRGVDVFGGPCRRPKDGTPGSKVCQMTQSGLSTRRCRATTARTPWPARPCRSHPDPAGGPLFAAGGDFEVVEESVAADEPPMAASGSPCCPLSGRCWTLSRIWPSAAVVVAGRRCRGCTSRSASSEAQVRRASWTLIRRMPAFGMRATRPSPEQPFAGPVAAVGRPRRLAVEAKRCVRHGALTHPSCRLRVRHRRRSPARRRRHPHLHALAATRHPAPAEGSSGGDRSRRHPAESHGKRDRCSQRHHAWNYPNPTKTGTVVYALQPSRTKPQTGREDHRRHR